MDLTTKRQEKNDSLQLMYFMYYFVSPLRASCIYGFSYYMCILCKVSLHSQLNYMMSGFSMLSFSNIDCMASMHISKEQKKIRCNNLDI